MQLTTIRDNSLHPSCHNASGLQKLQARQRSLQAGQPFLHSSGHWPLVDKGMPFESKNQPPESPRQKGRGSKRSDLGGGGEGT